MKNKESEYEHKKGNSYVRIFEKRGKRKGKRVREYVMKDKLSAGR